MKKKTPKKEPLLMRIAISFFNGMENLLIIVKIVGVIILLCITSFLDPNILNDPNDY